MRWRVAYRRWPCPIGTTYYSKVARKQLALRRSFLLFSLGHWSPAQQRFGCIQARHICGDEDQVGIAEHRKGLKHFGWDVGAFHLEFQSSVAANTGSAGPLGPGTALPFFLLRSAGGTWRNCFHRVTCRLLYDRQHRLLHICPNRAGSTVFQYSPLRPQVPVHRGVSWQTGTLLGCSVPRSECQRVV